MTLATPLPRNAARFSAAEITECAAAPPEADPGAGFAVEGVTTDSRAVWPGALFVALPGAGRHGAEFAGAAWAQGAAGILTDPAGAALAREAGGPLWVTEAPIGALQALARHHRRRFAVPVLAITGSAGKTSLRQVMHRMLEAAGYAVCATQGNLNNDIGVPMSLFCLDAVHDVGVFEVAMNRPGEIARLGAVVEPSVATVINARGAHRAEFADDEAVADEKCSLWTAAQREVVGNLDDARVGARLWRQDRPRITFGSDPNATVCLEHVELRGDFSCVVHLSWAGQRRQVALRSASLATGELVAAAVASLLPVFEDLAWPRAIAGLRDFSLGAPRRCEPKPAGRSGAWVLDASYNASPPAMLTNIASARRLAAARGDMLRCVLGDMAELGDYSEEAHQRAIEAVGEVEDVILVGPNFASAAKAIPKSWRCVASASEAMSLALDGLAAGQLIYVQGARCMQLDTLVDALTAQA